MRRLTDYRYCEPISTSLALLPAGVLPLVAHADFLCGVDPIYAGLHAYELTFDGRSYHSTAHCVYGHHQYALPADRRRTTVVLPDMRHAEPWVIVHELGHVLDEALGFSHDAMPTTEYSANNRAEAFAEAFAIWTGAYRSHGWKPEEDIWPDGATTALFARLEGNVGL